MTSPITAEERAEALYRDWVKHPAKGGLAEEIMALLASAIREAEDAALERAAELCVKAGQGIGKRAASNREEEIAFGGAVLAARACAGHIRNLKPTKETGHE